MHIEFNKTNRFSIAVASIVFLLFGAISSVLAHDPPDISQSFSLWAGITGTGTTLTYHDSPPYDGHYGRGKTQTSAAVYLQSYQIRAWSNYDYLHLLSEFSGSVMNGTLIQQTSGGAYLGTQPSWITTKHYWQGSPQPISQKRTEYTSYSGNHSTSGCWNGSPCP